MDHPTFSLDSVSELNFEEGTKYLGILGSPIQHSLSPLMHTAALQFMAKAQARWSSWRYIKIDVDPARLQEALELLWQKDFLGLNLTVPHKILAMDYIHALDEQAKRLGAINTLVHTPNGYVGLNTDGVGLLNALQEDLSIGPGLTDWPVVMVGAGGAARAAAVSLLDSGCPFLWVLNRGADALAAMREQLEDLGYGSDRVATRLLAEGLPNSLPETGLAIQATTLGLKPTDAFPIEPAAFPKNWRLYDLVYSRNSATSWTLQAQALGYQAADGLGMLLHQGAWALQTWTGCQPPLEVMRQTLQQACARA